MPDEPTRPTIKCAKNGPYLVRNLETFTNSQGDPIESRRTMALCRCGASKNKPFCDGSHDRVGFNSDKQDGRVEDRLDIYPGDGITIRDNRGICAHAGFCTDGCPAVWRMGVEPWIDPHGADMERIKRTIDKCPSGALSYEIDGEVRSDANRPPAIRVSKNGPYHVQGGIELQDEERGEGASLEHYTLCRCAGSKNKPFCDGTHWYIDFKDDEAGTGGDAAPKVETELTWYRVAALDTLPDGRVTTVMAGTHAVALTRVGGEYGALCNRCPHQGGPGVGTLMVVLATLPELDPLGVGEPPTGTSRSQSRKPALTALALL